MITINKSAKPAYCQRNARRNTYKVIEQIKAGKKPTFYKGAYSHNEIKERLRQDQRGKCCYCETKLGVNSHAEVEHFRPKSAIADEDGNLLHEKGYYWLVYEWANLAYACEKCNGHKGTKFPLVDEAKRVTNHSDAKKVAEEEPVLICPWEEDPAEHISFEDDVIIGRTERGEKTIKICDLDRTRLAEDRTEFFLMIETYFKLYKTVQKRGLSYVEQILEEMEVKFPITEIIPICKDVIAGASNYTGLFEANKSKLL